MGPSTLTLVRRSGVASTKAFTAQLTALFLFAVYLGQVRGTLDPDHSKQLLEELTRIPGKLEALLTHDEETEDLAKEYHRAHDFLFLDAVSTIPSRSKAR